MGDPNETIGEDTFGLKSQYRNQVWMGHALGGLGLKGVETDESQEDQDRPTSWIQILDPELEKYGNLEWAGVKEIIAFDEIPGFPGSLGGLGFLIEDKLIVQLDDVLNLDTADSDENNAERIMHSFSAVQTAIDSKEWNQRPSIAYVHMSTLGSSCGHATTLEIQWDQNNPEKVINITLHEVLMTPTYSTTHENALKKVAETTGITCEYKTHKIQAPKTINCVKNSLFVAIQLAKKKEITIHGSIYFAARLHRERVQTRKLYTGLENARPQRLGFIHAQVEKKLQARYGNTIPIYASDNDDD